MAAEAFKLAGLRVNFFGGDVASLYGALLFSRRGYAVKVYRSLNRVMERPLRLEATAYRGLRSLLKSENADVVLSGSLPIRAIGPLGGPFQIMQWGDLDLASADQEGPRILDEEGLERVLEALCLCAGVDVVNLGPLDHPTGEGGGVDVVSLGGRARKSWPIDFHEAGAVPVSLYSSTIRFIVPKKNHAYLNVVQLWEGEGGRLCLEGHPDGNMRLTLFAATSSRLEKLQAMIWSSREGSFAFLKALGLLGADASFPGAVCHELEEGGFSGDKFFGIGAAFGALDPMFNLECGESMMQLHRLAEFLDGVKFSQGRAVSAAAVAWNKRERVRRRDQRRMHRFWKWLCLNKSPETALSLTRSLPMGVRKWVDLPF